MQLSKKRKIFAEIFLDFLNLGLILNNFKIKMTLIPDIFLNLRTRRDVVR